MRRERLAVQAREKAVMREYPGSEMDPISSPVRPRLSPLGQDLCHCGKSLHYTDMKTKAQVDMIVDRFGSHIAVNVEGRTFQVPRHYIALHGIQGKDLERLGFKELAHA